MTRSTETKLRGDRGAKRGDLARRGRPSRLAAVLGVLVACAGAGLTLTAAGGARGRQLAHAAASGSKWTVYHADRSGSGNFRRSISLSHVHQVWRSPTLTGQL